MIYRKILKNIMVTEKASHLAGTQNKYTFEIYGGVSKGQVKEAVEKLYSVKVRSVNVLKNSEKTKTNMVNRRKKYRTGNVKKAIVELDSKDSLKFYEGSAS